MDLVSKKKKESFTVKFYFVDGDESSGVELRFITEEMQKKAYDELVEVEIDYAVHPKTKKLTKVKTEDVTPNALENWLIDKWIVSWWGVTLDGKEVECTKDNKVDLFKNHDTFTNFIAEKLGVLNKMAEESFGGKSETKNLNSM